MLKALKKNWLAISIILSVVIVACCIQPMCFFIIGLIAYGIYELYEHDRERNILLAQQTKISQENTVRSVYMIAVRIFRKLSKTLEIEPPSTISDVCSNPMIITKQGLCFVRCKVRCLPNNTEDYSVLPAIMRHIQATINNALICGELDDLVGTRSVNGKDPILIVENVLFEDGYLVVDFGVLDNEIMRNYLCCKARTIRSNSSGSCKTNRTDNEF